MAVGGPQSYFIKGASPLASGQNLIEALSNLWTFWFATPSLRRVDPGNLVIELSLNAQVVRVEITDPALLNKLMRNPSAGPQAILDHLAKHTGLPFKQGQELLMEAQAEVSVDTIRDPKRPNAWQPGEEITPNGKLVGAKSVEDELPEASGRFLGELAREDDKVSRRAPGAPRGKRGAELLRQIVEYGQSQKLTNKKLSQITGVSSSTLGDARRRFAPPAPKKLPKSFKGRKRGQAITSQQKRVILNRLKKTKGNAAQVARDLGLPPRTVRDVRARAKASASRASSSVGTRKKGARAASYTPADKQQLLQLMQGQNLTATAAGRQLGVPARTARSWARKAKLGL